MKLNKRLIGLGLALGLSFLPLRTYSQEKNTLITQEDVYTEVVKEFKDTKTLEELKEKTSKETITSFLVLYHGDEIDRLLPREAYLKKPLLRDISDTLARRYEEHYLELSLEQFTDPEKRVYSHLPQWKSFPFQRTAWSSLTDVAIRRWRIVRKSAEVVREVQKRTTYEEDTYFGKLRAGIIIKELDPSEIRARVSLKNGFGTAVVKAGEDFLRMGFNINLEKFKDSFLYFEANPLGGDEKTKMEKSIGEREFDAKYFACFMKRF